MQVDAEEGTADRLRAVAEPTDMDAFLRSVERRGFLMARVALGSEADAMDVLQDSMLRLVQSYAARPAAEWRALFFRILQNCITDVRRRRKVSSLLTAWRKPRGEEDEEQDPLHELPDPRDGDPARLVAGERRAAALLAALGRLPERQQQAFMLRCWEGLSTAETAQAMRCSEGSVKTHYFRALHTLRERLQEHWP